MKFWEKVIVALAMTLLVVVSVAIVFGGLFLGLTGLFTLIGVVFEILEKVNLPFTE